MPTALMKNAILNLIQRNERMPSHFYLAHTRMIIDCSAMVKLLNSEQVFSQPSSTPFTKPLYYGIHMLSQTSYALSPNCEQLTLDKVCQA